MERSNTNFEGVSEDGLADLGWNQMSGLLDLHLPVTPQAPGGAASSAAAPGTAGTSSPIAALSGLKALWYGLTIAVLIAGTTASFLLKPERKEEVDLLELALAKTPATDTEEAGMNSSKNGEPTSMHFATPNSAKVGGANVSSTSPNAFQHEMAGMSWWLGTVESKDAFLNESKNSHSTIQLSPIGFAEQKTTESNRLTFSPLLQNLDTDFSNTPNQAKLEPIAKQKSAAATLPQPAVNPSASQANQILPTATGNTISTNSTNQPSVESRRELQSDVPTQAPSSMRTEVPGDGTMLLIGPKRLSAFPFELDSEVLFPEPYVLAADSARKLSEQNQPLPYWVSHMGGQANLYAAMFTHEVTRYEISTAFRLNGRSELRPRVGIRSMQINNPYAVLESEKELSFSYEANAEVLELKSTFKQYDRVEYLEFGLNYDYRVLQRLTLHGGFSGLFLANVKGTEEEWSTKTYSPLEGDDFVVRDQQDLGGIANPKEIRSFNMNFNVGIRYRLIAGLGIDLNMDQSFQRVFKPNPNVVSGSNLSLAAISVGIYFQPLLR